MTRNALLPHHSNLPPFHYSLFSPALWLLAPGSSPLNPQFQILQFEILFPAPPTSNWPKGRAFNGFNACLRIHVDNHEKICE
jgi:hypothetical protein